MNTSAFYVTRIIAGLDGVFGSELPVAPLGSHFATTLGLQHLSRGLLRLGLKYRTRLRLGLNRCACFTTSHLGIGKWCGLGVCSDETSVLGSPFIDQEMALRPLIRALTGHDELRFGSLSATLAWSYED
mgnify:CR=1 FL=1